MQSGSDSAFDYDSAVLLYLDSSIWEQQHALALSSDLYRPVNSGMLIISCDRNFAVDTVNGNIAINSSNI